MKKNDFARILFSGAKNKRVARELQVRGFFMEISCESGWRGKLDAKGNWVNVAQDDMEVNILEIPDQAMSQCFHVEFTPATVASLKRRIEAGLKVRFRGCVL